MGALVARERDRETRPDRDTQLSIVVQRREVYRSGMKTSTAPVPRRPKAGKRSGDGFMGRPASHGRKARPSVCETGDGSRSGAVTKIPSQARAGLMRAWLTILAERHPDVTWVTVTDDASVQVAEPATAACETPASGEAGDARNGGGALLPERDWLTLLEAAWLLQVREHTARQMVADEAHPDRPLKPYPGSGSRVKVTAESVEQLVRGSRAKTRLAQLKKHQIRAPKPACRCGSPAALTTGMTPLNLSGEVVVSRTEAR